MTRLASIALLLCLSGCLGVTESPERDASETEVSLAELLPADAVLVGVAITPGGKRYVLDQRSGLYELGDRSARVVADTKLMSGLDLTDVVALDEEHFALTAENDGFLLNLETALLSSYFCYLPAVPPQGTGTGPGPISVSQTLREQGIEVSQRTDSVAFNATTRQLFAQPRTTRLDTGAVVGSELFVFTEQGGEPIEIVGITDPSFVAGGMLATSSSRLVLGAGNRLYEVGPSGELRVLRELAPGVDIKGLAEDVNPGTIWVLDGAGRQLISIDDRF